MAPTCGLSSGAPSARLPSVMWVLVALGALVVDAINVAPTTLRGHSLLTARVQQPLTLALPKGSIDFNAVRPAPLVTIEVDTASEHDAKVAASTSATSFMVSADLETQTIHLHPEKKLGPKQVPLAWASYNNSVSQTGWAYISVRTSSDDRASRELKMYAAGFVEGLASAKQIRDFQHNAGSLIANDEDRHHAMGNIKMVFDKELRTICKKSNIHSGVQLTQETMPKDPIWQQARYALMQSWGTMDAFNRQVDIVKGKPMSLIDLLILNSDGETPELEMAYDLEEYLLRQSDRPDADSDNGADVDNSVTQVLLQKQERHHNEKMPFASKAAQRSARRTMEMRQLNDRKWRHIKDETGRCSALIRLTKDNQDLMVGHTTFSDYAEMNRVFKYYDFPLGDGVVQKMGFSSYPGVAGSTDDYYLLDSGLVVTETTISMLTDEPYDKLDDNGTMVPDFMRIMIANRLAKTGQEWASIMQQTSSGTYSSQWMVVDYNKFVPGKPLQNGTLVVLEQVPAMNRVEDMSMHLQQSGFWSSENRPWFKDIRDGIGATEAQELHGNLFSADKNPRANIFRATAPHVQSLANMRDELQRNKWPHEVDGGAGNTPDHAISARGDLDKENPNPNGGVDSKVTNFCLAKKLQCNAISGPTHDSQKPFAWTDASGKELYKGVQHDGLPNVWNFDWVRMSPDGEFGDLACSP